MAQKRVQGVKDGPTRPEDEILNTLETKFPSLNICGKSSEYYKCNEVLDMIKDKQNDTYDSPEDFRKNLIMKLNKIHSKETNKGNGKKDDSITEFYNFKDTSKYI